jgi:adenine deaminase
MHQELAFYQEAGMNNFEVLKTATINPSKAHKEFEQMGSIEIENLDEFRKPEWVMANGRKISEETLNEFADNARDRSNMVATALRYVEYLLVEK